jgi:uncharacterized RDD family membrane protein YckC
VFISYSREDGEFAMRLVTDLKNRGANVWLDQMDIRPGLQWDREVERALMICNEMLVILSPAAVSSNNVMDEVAFALEEQKAVIPVLYRECRLSFRLRRLQYIDLKSNYEKGLTSLILALAGEAQVTTDPGNPYVIASKEIREGGLTEEADAKRAEPEDLERENAEAAKRAEQEHLNQARPEVAASGGTSELAPVPDHFAHFGRRFLSFVVDGGIFGILLAGGVGVASAVTAEENLQLALSYGVCLPAHFAYQMLTIRSKHRATLGMRAAGVYITSLDGDRLSWKRATIRHIAKLLSLYSMIGPFMPLWTKRRQTLHDLITGTVVRRRGN